VVYERMGEELTFSENMNGALSLEKINKRMEWYTGITHSFLDYELKKLVIGTNITIIEPSGFCNCINLEGIIHIPPTVTSVGVDAFANCPKLTLIYFK
jgi:hypothetical protein